MPKKKKSLGNWGEDKAVSFLQERGFSILKRNLRFPFGEVDIIAQKEKILFFCEVKTRSGTCYGEGWEAVSPRKIQRIQKVAETYLGTANPDMDVRIAVISILHTGGGVEIEFFPV